MLDNNSNLQKGQALLVIVLVMVVALTAGLSIAIRTTTNIRTTEDDENSQKAFSAAEAGLEQSLGANPSSIAGSIDGASYNTTISDSSTSSLLLNNGVNILKDEPVDVWLSSYPNYTGSWSGNLTISWGVQDNSCNSVEDQNTHAAVEIHVISTTTPLTPKDNPRLATYTFDPCADRRVGNKFEQADAPGDTIENKQFAYKKTIPVTSGLIMRIIPLYASTKIGVQKGSSDLNLPIQGKIVSSTGTFDTIQRKIVSFRGYPKLPVEIFPFIIFSPK